MRLRPWQVELVGSVLDPDPRPRTAGWMLPRGQGKTTLVAALGLYDLMLGDEGASVVVAATDERQAGLCFRTAARMVELNPELEARVQQFQDRLAVPERGASFQVLPAAPKRLEGLDPTTAILDEIGVMDREVYETISLASGKRETSLVLGIGTPGPDPDNSVLLDMRVYAAEHPDDLSFVWREFSAADFPDHPVDCEHCWLLANPAMDPSRGDPFLYRDAMAALLPPKMREQVFRRARLCQVVHGVDEPWLPPGTWEACEDARPIPDGATVVLALDGSFSQDATALVAASVETVPHIDVVALWEPPVGDPDYRVPVLDVEQAVRDACRRWNVRTVAADPFRYTRSLQILEGEGFPVVEFPQSPSRMTPATQRFFEAVVSDGVTHSGDSRLARHIGNAVLKQDSRGVRITKDGKHSKRRIDLAVSALMAFDLAASTEPEYSVLDSIW